MFEGGATRVMPSTFAYQELRSPDELDPVLAELTDGTTS